MINPAANQTAPVTALILGDAMVDTYLDANPVGISDEAPVTVLDWVNTARTFGGMLNTATTLATLGFDTHAIGLVNEADEPGRFVNDECSRLGIQQHWFNDGRPTIEKARVRTNPQHPPIEQLARIDVEWDAPLDAAVAQAVQTQFDDLARTATVIVVSDYCKGLLTHELAQHLIRTARENNIPILVDAKPSTLNWFKGATLLTPNEAEARTYLTEQCADATAASLDHQTLVARLAEQLQASILLTCAGAGMYLQRADEENATRIPAPDIAHVESTSGAGDVVIATMALAAAQNKSLATGANWATQAVRQTLVRKGTCALTAADLTNLKFD